MALHLSQYEKGNLGRNSLNAQERADALLPISQKKRKLIERTYNRVELTSLLRQLKLRPFKTVESAFVASHPFRKERGMDGA